MGKRQSKGQGRADGMEVPVRFPTATSCKGRLLLSLEDSVPTPPSEQGPVPHLLKDAIVPHFVRGFVPHDQDLQGGREMRSRRIRDSLRTGHAPHGLPIHLVMRTERVRLGEDPRGRTAGSVAHLSCNSSLPSRTWWRSSECNTARPEALPGDS